MLHGTGTTAWRLNGSPLAAVPVEVSSSLPDVIDGKVMVKAAVPSAPMVTVVEPTTCRVVA